MNYSGFIYSLYEFFAISFIKLNKLNKIQIKYLVFFKGKLQSLNDFSFVRGERCHCAL